MYAIWKYDVFPYKICGKVVKELDNGWVTVEGYDSMKFKPTQLLGDKQGKRVKEMFEREERAYRLEKSKLEERFKKIVKASLELIGVPSCNSIS